MRFDLSFSLMKKKQKIKASLLRLPAGCRSWKDPETRCTQTTDLSGRSLSPSGWTPIR